MRYRDFVGRVWNVSPADRQRIRQAARETLARVRPSNFQGVYAPASWYRIDNRIEATNGERSAEIFIYDEIGASWWGGGVSADDFVRELATLNVDRIDLRLNTPGGDAFDGIAIYNALRVHRAHVHSYVDALAASAGSIIAMAGDKITVRRAGRMMIHDAAGLAVGKAADMRAFADLLDALSDDIASTYVAKAGGTVEHWRNLMLEEKWFSGEEAVAAGLADNYDDGPAPETDESIVPGDGAGSDPLAAWNDMFAAHAETLGVAPAARFERIESEAAWNDMFAAYAAALDKALVAPAIEEINIDASAMLAALRGESRS